MWFLDIISISSPGRYSVVAALEPSALRVIFGYTKPLPPGPPVMILSVASPGMMEVAHTTALFRLLAMSYSDFLSERKAFFSLDFNQLSFPSEVGLVGGVGGDGGTMESDDPCLGTETGWVSPASALSLT